MGGVRWKERLSGHLSFDQADFNQAWLEGKRDDVAAALALTLQIDDIEHFAASARRLARIEPESCFDCPAMEGRMDAVRGQFELFAASDELIDGLHLRMRYDADLRDAQGRHYHIAAFKLVENDPGYDSWADTSTLFARLHLGWWTEHGLWNAEQGFSTVRGWESDAPEGSADERQLRAPYATAILKLSPLGFVGEVASFRGTEGGALRQAEDVRRFFGLFVGGLARAYWGRPVPDGRPSFPRDRRPPPWLPPAAGDPHPVPGRREEDLARTGRHNLMREVIPYEVDDLTYPLTLHHVWDAEETLEEVRAAGRPAVMLNHGAGMRAQMYYGQPAGVSLVDHLLSAGYDVWVQNWRGSIDFPAHSYTLDEVAEQDHPSAVATVKELTGGKAIRAFVHCMGSVSFMVAAVAGYLDSTDVSDVVSSNISLYFKVSGAAWLKQRLLVPSFSLIGRGGDPQWGIRAQTPAGVALAKVASLAQRRCRNGPCQVANFMYGSGHEVLLQHKNVDDVVHAWTARELGYTPFSLIRQVAESSRYGRIVAARKDASEKHDRTAYLARPPRTGGSGGTHFTLIAGGENQMFAPVGQRLTEAFLHQFDVPAKFIELPGYGHVDTVLGRDAPADVFPVVSGGLEWSSTGVEPQPTGRPAPPPGPGRFSAPPPA